MIVTGDGRRRRFVIGLYPNMGDEPALGLLLRHCELVLGVFGVAVRDQHATNIVVDAVQQRGYCTESGNVVQQASDLIDGALPIESRSCDAMVGIAAECLSTTGRFEPLVSSKRVERVDDDPFGATLTRAVVKDRQSATRMAKTGGSKTRCPFGIKIVQESKSVRSNLRLVMIFRVVCNQERTFRPMLRGLVNRQSLTTGEMVPPGIVHDITLRLLIGQRLEVKDFEVEMKHVPREECREMLSSLEPLIGRRISPGFTLWVKENLGGPKGCTHLNELLLAMAPASVQGLWSATASRPVTLSEVTAAFDARYLVDSCRVWRADGPLVMELRKTLESNPSSTERRGD